MEYEDQYDYEREADFEIAGGYLSVTVVISDVQIAVETWTERGNARDYETRWIHANVTIRPKRSSQVIWTGMVRPEDLDTNRRLIDAGISDLLDEIAEEAFLRDYRDGEFGEIR